MKKTAHYLLEALRTPLANNLTDLRTKKSKKIRTPIAHITQKELPQKLI